MTSHLSERFSRFPILPLAALSVALSLVACGGSSNSSGGGGGGGTGTGGGGTGPSYTIPVMAPSVQPTLACIHDPAIFQQGSVYYLMATDPGNGCNGNPQVGYIPIYSSTDHVTWSRVGSVFNQIPAYVMTYLNSYYPNSIPTNTSAYTFWAPDISYFNGLYHVYFAASGFGQNVSLIGLVTSPTLNPNDPNYAWTSQGMVLSSNTTSNFNAIDPSILVDTDSSGNPNGNVYLQYGSFWGGIYQQQINPATGLLMANSTPTLLAQRTTTASSDAIEGSNLIKKGSYYYLFASFGYCCESTAAADTYQIAVGRSSSPTGPFVDMNGSGMIAGGGTILLEGNGSTWFAPGGSTALIGSTGGDLIVYHALQPSSLDYLFTDTLSFTTGWPVINQ
jgi:arabinan endo-1,5-alpha-L-arabinosidase